MDQTLSQSIGSNLRDSLGSLNTSTGNVGEAVQGIPGSVVGARLVESKADAKIDDG